MNYKETLAYLYGRLPMFQRVGNEAYKKDLSNISKLCFQLGNPENKFKSIHIAGTNGKGSVSHMIAAILQQQGYRVGMYTSPHYKDFRERIKINGELIPKEKVVNYTSRVKSIIEDIEPSFFEATVAMAFDYFAESEVDYAVIETGMGGRLDSTNVITPLLSVITNISFDHVNILGDTLPLIAGEKAGIIKKEVPVVIGERNKETEPVFRAKASEQHSDLFFAEDIIDYKGTGNDDEYIYAVDGKEEFRISMNYPGPFQAENIRTALAASLILNRMNIVSLDGELLRNAFRNIKKMTYYLGRWEKLMETPLVIADSAHNEAGLAKAIAKLKELSASRYHFVIGFVNDKSIDKLLQLFPKSEKYYFAKADIPRGLSAKILQDQAKAYGLNGRHYVSVKNAYQAALRNASKDDLIFIGGSIFVVAEII